MSTFTIIIQGFARLALLLVWALTPLVNRAFHGGLAPTTAWDPLLAVYHPGLCPRLCSPWKRCDRLGLALGRPGIASGPGSV